MSLDLHATLIQLDAVAANLHAVQGKRKSQINQLTDMLIGTTEETLNEILDGSTSHMFFRPCEPTENPGSTHPSQTIPEDFRIVASDGSHIDIDRHLPIRCHLLNMGTCQITYGSSPSAELSSTPTLAADPAQLTISDPRMLTRFQTLTGDLLGVKRSLEEVRNLGELLKAQPDPLPTLGLLDGSLIFWQLANEAEFIKEHLLDHGVINVMDELMDLASGRLLAVAGYISLPNSREVVNTLRLLSCPFLPIGDCNRHCRETPAGQRPCDLSNDIADRDLFMNILKPNERSATFASLSPVVTERYREHRVCFFYLRTEQEIVRIEIPEWVAKWRDQIDLVHTLVVDQNRRGHGYPVALQEAHEQAVINGSDREEFKRMVEWLLQQHGLPVYTSEKQRSKQGRWV